MIDWECFCCGQEVDVLKPYKWLNMDAPDNHGVAHPACIDEWAKASGSSGV